MATKATKAAAAASLLCLAGHSTGFAAPSVKVATQPATFGKATSAAAPRGSPASATSGAAPSASQISALSAAVGVAVGAASRMSRRATKSPEDTYRAVVAGGDIRMAATPSEVVLSGIVTGFYIGFGGVLCSTVGGSALGLAPGLQRFLFGAVGFPLSIFLTTIACGQGFTPNVGVMATAFMRKGADRELQGDKIAKMFANLGYAHLGNAIGLITIAYLANLAFLPAVPAAMLIAKHKVEHTFTEIVVRGILGGWLIGLAIWCSQAADDVASKFVCIWLCISTYVICQYEHCLANLFFVPCAIFAGAKITWADFIFKSLIPSTIGNFFGGFFMLAGFYRFVYGRKCYLDDQAQLVCDVDVD